jgi:hypothetical protein
MSLSVKRAIHFDAVRNQIEDSKNAPSCRPVALDVRTSNVTGTGIKG